MKVLEQIANFCKSAAGIVSFSIVIIGIGSSVLIRHDAKVIKTYTDTIMVKTNLAKG